MNDSSIDRQKANAEAFERLCSAEPVLTDLCPAIDVLPNKSLID
jgi:hypothetical protein